MYWSIYEGFIRVFRYFVGFLCYSTGQHEGFIWKLHFLVYFLGATTTSSVAIAIVTTTT